MDIEVRQPNASGRSKQSSSSSSGGMSPDKIKGIVAGAIIVLAGLIFAWTQGIFSGNNQDVPTPEEAVQQDQDWEEIQKEAEETWRPSRPGERRPTPSGA